MWRMMLIVAAAGLLASFSFNIYLIKQNHLLMNQRSQLKEQIQQTQLLIGTLRTLVEDIARFSLQYPDARDILLKYGLKVNVTGPASPVPPATVPALPAPATNQSAVAVVSTPPGPAISHAQPVTAPATPAPATNKSPADVVSKPSGSGKKRK